MTSVAAAHAWPSRTGRVLMVNFAVCILLVAQYLLGMVANLFATIPARHPGANASNYFSGSASGLGWVIPSGPAWLAAHASLGLALGLAALASLVLTWGLGGRACTLLSALGLLTIIGAGFNGLSFLDYGHNFSSMIMAGLWAAALVCYLSCMFLAGRLHAPPEADNG
jgi:hypothetical protein